MNTQQHRPHPLSMSDPELALVDAHLLQRGPRSLLPPIINAAEQADPTIKQRVEARKARKLLIQQRQQQQQQQQKATSPAPPPVPVLSLFGSGGDDDDDSSSSEGGLPPDLPPAQPQEQQEEVEEEEKSRVDSDDYLWGNDDAKEHMDSDEDSSLVDVDAAATPVEQQPQQDQEPLTPTKTKGSLRPLTAEHFETLTQSLSAHIPAKTRQQMPILLSSSSPLVEVTPPPTIVVVTPAAAPSMSLSSLEEGQIVPERESLASRFTNLGLPVPPECDTVEKEQALDGAFYMVTEHLPRMFVGMGGPPPGQQTLPAAAHHGQSVEMQLLARAKNHTDLGKAANILLQLTERAQLVLDKVCTKGDT